MIKLDQNRFLKWIIVFTTTSGLGLFIAFPYTSISSLLYSITLSFLMMIWISIVVSLLRPALKSPYYNSRPFEKEGRVYKYLGVDFYRKLLVLSGWEKNRKKETPISRSLELLKYYEYRTRASEFGHAIIAIIIVFITIYVCIAYSFKETVWLIVLNIFINIYPIIVQRYNRPRVQRVIRKLEL